MLLPEVKVEHARGSCCQLFRITLFFRDARVAELVDALDLGFRVHVQSCSIMPVFPEVIQFALTGMRI